MARLVDTSVVIGMERRGYSRDRWSAFLRDAPTAIASVSVSELLAGLHRAPSGWRMRLREAFIDSVIETVPVIPYDLAAARAHATLIDELRRSGQPIGANDVLIAAIALSNGYSVLTHSLRDFERVPGLVVEQPTWSD